MTMPAMNKAAKLLGKRSAALATRRQKRENLALALEVKKALRDWNVALNHFEHAVGPDQTEYAIYALEAAEKKYEMLLRQAKAAKLTLWDDEIGGVMEGWT